MKFCELSKYLSVLEKTSSRLEITRILSRLFSEVKSEEIKVTTYLILGKLAPGFEGIVFNIAENMMIRSISKASGKDEAEVKKLYKKLGDMGDVTESLSGGSERNLAVKDVYGRLKNIALEQGEGSVERKVDAVSQLLSELDSLSAKYVTRIILGRLRLGFSDKTVLDAMSWLETGGKTQKQKLESAYNLLPDVGLLAEEFKKRGIEKAVEKIEPKLGVPILPMLAQRLKSPAEMIEKMGKVLVEPKFDGLRIQIHFKRSGFESVFGSERKTTFRVFTRNLNETSWMFPELEGVADFIKADDVVLDSEAVGVDEERKALANFQTTMTRRRKHDIEKISSKVSIKFFVFDIMFKNGESLVNLPYFERREILSQTLENKKNLRIVDYEEVVEPEKITSLMQKNLSEGLEGIIVKRFDSGYVAGRTGWRWVKMKEKESAKAKLSDTVDCIVMGYSVGRGKRVSFGLGQFLVGVLDKGKVKTVTKVGTGLTDDQFKELKKRLRSLEIKEKPREYEVHKNLTPDFWVEPSLVVEIAADELTKSPTHTSGYALRFPRLVRFREDKGLNDATGSVELKKLFKLQN
jgi:DNA ligase 1